MTPIKEQIEEILKVTTLDVWENQEEGQDFVSIRDKLLSLCESLCLEVIKSGVNHATLPDPNRYGKTVSVKRHNQVVTEAESLMRAKLAQLLGKEK